MSTSTSPQYYTTEELAGLVRGKPNAIRTRLCKAGSYYGIKPVKMPSGRLLWPADKVTTLLNVGGNSHAS